MSKYIPGNQKHLTLNDRIYIENELNKGTSFKIILCGVKCASCPACNQTCKDFHKELCSRLEKAPYVCNGCDKKINHCTIAHKYIYNTRFADRKYRERLHDSRAGINLTRQQLHQKDRIVSPLIEQGQSPYHILANHPELDMSVRTMYTYLDNGVFSARNIDLKRKVRFKPRKYHKTQITDRSVFTNRLIRISVLLGCLLLWRWTPYIRQESQKRLC